MGAFFRRLTIGPAASLGPSPYHSHIHHYSCQRKITPDFQWNLSHKFTQYIKFQRGSSLTVWAQKAGPLVPYLPPNWLATFGTGFSSAAIDLKRVAKVTGSTIAVGEVP